MRLDSEMSAATGVLLFVLLGLCAWAYPRLNHWVYRRRLARDAAAEAAWSPRPD
jgi:hypothetical protein